MYLIGAPHPHKIDAQLMLEKVIAARQKLVTSAEVLQEILHRYTSLNRRDAVAPAIQVLLDMVDEVFPIEKNDVLRASEIVQQPAGLSARDGLHIAVMERRGIRRILTFDGGFDRWPGLERLHRP